MTVQEWLECADPKPMLEFLRGKASDRKLRLFAVACCRRIWHLLEDERCEVEVAERFADGNASKSEIERAVAEGEVASQNPDSDRWASADPDWPGIIQAPHVSFAAASRAASIAAGEAASSSSPGSSDAWNTFGQICAIENKGQSQLLHDIFGNPFRPITIDPTWLTPRVFQLAQAIYDNRAFDRMTELAVALVEAGCDNDEILRHCRGPGPHVRGCWVVDLILGKQ